jgi:ribosomal-protein-alanine N-acetyltransferase
MATPLPDAQPPRRPDLQLQLGGADLDTVPACLSFIHDFLSPPHTHGQNFAIAVNGEAVGDVGLSNIERHHDTGSVYSWVAAQHQRQGLAARAQYLAYWAFSEVGLFRLEVGHRVNDPNSFPVVTRAGFAPEGVERSELRYGGTRFDVELHARLSIDPEPKLPVLAHGLS